MYCFGSAVCYLASTYSRQNSSWHVDMMEHFAVFSKQMSTKTELKIERILELHSPGEQ